MSINPEKQTPPIIPLPSLLNVSEIGRALQNYTQQVRSDLDNGRMNFTHTTITAWSSVSINDFDKRQIQFYTNSVTSEYRLYTRIGDDLYYTSLTKV